MCQSRVQSAHSALYLKPNTSLCPSPTTLLLCCILSSSLLHSEQSSASEMTSSVSNHPPATDRCWFYCVFLLDTQDHWIPAFSHSITLRFLSSSCMFDFFLILNRWHTLLSYWSYPAFCPPHSCLLQVFSMKYTEWAFKHDLIHTVTSCFYVQQTHRPECVTFSELTAGVVKCQR